MARLIRGETFANVYEELLRQLTNKPEFTDTAPRGMRIKEISDVVLQIERSEINMFDNDARGIDHRYLAGELLWYFAGRRDIEFISKYSSFWENIKNNDGTLNSAYGYQLWGTENQFGFTEWKWAIAALSKDADSRQAIIRFNKPEVSFDGNKDFICTLAGVFQIRDGKLNLAINMRSSDAILGLTFDIPFFSLLIQAMRAELLPIVPDLEIGKLTMLLNSSHIYERHFELVKEMLDNPFTDCALPIYESNLVNLPVNKILSYKLADDALASWIKDNC